MKLLLCSLGFFILTILTPTAKAATTTMSRVPNQAETQKTVREYFKDTPVMIEIARCESDFRQFTDSGAALRGGSANGMIGIYQFFESIHAPGAKKLGFDLATVAGNLGYAKHVYTTQGTVPWASARNCWDVKSVTEKVPTATQVELKEKIKQLTQLIKVLQQLHDLRKMPK